MKNLTIMLKPASSDCNMRCNYCFYNDISERRSVASYGKIQVGTLHKILDNVFFCLDKGDHVTFVFQGGEPTLVGLSFYIDFIEYCGEKTPDGVCIHYALQTNGLLLDEAWCKFLKENHFLVGLSWDGPANIHDFQRKDSLGAGTYSRILQAKSFLEKYEIEYNVLMVLTKVSARHPQKIWNFILKNDIKYIQFIPCLGPVDGSTTPWELTPDRYAHFYMDIFDLWFTTYQKGRYISIKLFDDYINLLGLGECNACGLLGFCSSQIVVEADGSVYPCDFYVLDEYRAGNLAEQSLKDIYLSDVMRQFPEREIPLKEICLECPFIGICGGGCPRMQKEVFYLNRDKICGHRLFLEHCIRRMSWICMGNTGKS